MTNFNYNRNMQGIYKGFDLYIHDITWTCLLDIVQKSDGNSNINDIYEMLEDNCGEIDKR